MSKHTPGPWSSQEGANTCRIWGPAPDLNHVQLAEVHRIGQYGTEEHIANARLIAAAPDLLHFAETAYTYLTREMEARTLTRAEHDLLYGAATAVTKGRG